MIIKVEQHHIEKGIPDDYNLCPVALAVTEQLNAEDVEVFVDRATIEVKGTKFTTPIDVSAFIDAFDHMLPVSPMEFTLGDPV